MGETSATPMKILLLSALVAVVSILPLQADTFGTGSNQFTLDFQMIGNAGNSNDTTGYGGVSYSYRIGKYAISQNQINAATVNGLLGVTGSQGHTWSGDQPATGLTWYQMAAFVNYLNTNQGYAPAYSLTYSNGSYSMALWPTNQAWTMGGTNQYRNANCFYFLPSENEWYKAAYYDPNKNGTGLPGYWLYPEACDTPPTAVASGTNPQTAVFNPTPGGPAPYSAPASVYQAGGLSPYGTMGQGGNIWEWLESSYSGINTNVTQNRFFRGGVFSFGASFGLKSTWRQDQPSYVGFSPDTEQVSFGFRVASIDDSWLTNGLVAWYPLQGNANDYSGNGHSFLTPPLFGTDRFGISNSAAVFNASTPISTAPFTNSNTLFVSFWFNITNTPSIYGERIILHGSYNIFDWNDPAAASFGIAIWSDGRYAVSWLDSNRIGQDIKLPAGTLIQNRWYQAFFSSDGTTVKFGLNGQTIGSKSSTIMQVSEPLVIGGESSYYFNSGSIDDIRFYNRALSSNEVTALYNLESHPYCNGHWENDEASEAAAWVNYFSSNLPSNSGFYSALAANPNFLSALANAFTSSPSTYGILQQGPQGIQGPIGLSGLKGNTGASGLQGIQGIQGPIGAVGPQGPKGDKGDTGAIGPIGLTGLQGIQGPVGVFDPTVLTNTAFLQSLATNSTFLNALSTQIKTGLNNYGLAVKQNQSLNFPVIPPQTLTPTSTVTINVTSSANQTPITYSSGNTAVATVSNNILKLIGSGSTTIIASQAGNNLYNPISVSQPLVVSKGVQTINFPAIPTQTFSPWKTVTLKSTSSANPSANLTNSYIIGNGAIGSISNNVLLLLGTGSTTVTATNGGNAYFSPASATQTLIVK